MSTATTEPTQPPSGFAEPEQLTLGDAARAYGQKVRGGDVGSLPAIAGLIVLVAVFAALKQDTFTNSFNVANLINQSAAVIVIAMGLVFVLLLGEIDLSAGYTAGVCAAVMGIVMTNHGVAWPIALLACLATGAVIGTVLGWLVAYLGIPSFVVTLAAFLGLQGLLLQLIGEGGTIAYRDDTILAVMNKNLPVWLGWTLFLVLVVLYAGLTFRRSVARRAAGLAGDPLAVWATKTLALVIVVGAAVAYLSTERSKNPQLTSLKGVPIVVAVLVALLIVTTFALNRTSWGRHVYAVGGNAEAARRAGINVAAVKLSCFMICSTLAAIAGVLLASRDNSVSPTTGGSQTLLYAVGAAVIGGTSLFGGKGRTLDAIIGGLVIAVIDNGMSLLNQSAGNVYMVTGAVLLIAASVDALSRRRAAATGRG
ncbi:sugar ABC transporter permease [Spongisporangium articulatum]|uniref:Xylose transport system permease protein XylH n=1 Tax=Spongisporangium articulatum TaxID=3362603 RepID=A0ABW8AMX0_9ACTN